MWLDYPYARPLMPGAYHYATKLNIPILPLFVTFKKNEIGDTIYTINVGKPLYPNQELSLSENKETMMQKDYTFKRSVYS